MRRLLPLAALVVTLVLAAWAGAWPLRSAALTSGGGFGGQGFPGRRYPDMVVGTADLCLDRPGHVHVTSVTADGDLDVRGFTIQPYWGLTYLGDFAGTITRMKLPASVDPLTVVCDAGARHSYQLLVQVHATRTMTASTAFTVHYLSDGRSSTLTIPAEILMCPALTASACDRAPFTTAGAVSSGSEKHRSPPHP